VKHLLVAAGIVAALLVPGTVAARDSGSHLVCQVKAVPAAIGPRQFPRTIWLCR
jgi:hypothetical protein